MIDRSSRDIENSLFRFCGECTRVSCVRVRFLPSARCFSVVRSSPRDTESDKVRTRAIRASRTRSSSVVIVQPLGTETFCEIRFWGDLARSIISIVFTLPFTRFYDTVSCPSLLYYYTRVTGYMLYISY